MKTMLLDMICGAGGPKTHQEAEMLKGAGLIETDGPRGEDYRWRRAGLEKLSCSQLLAIYLRIRPEALDG